MICPCGKEIDSSAGYSYQTCTYNDKGEIVNAVCMHGIVCINKNIEILTHIEILEDLKISCKNHGYYGFHPVEINRTTERIIALDYVINLLKEKIK